MLILNPFLDKFLCLKSHNYLKIQSLSFEKWNLQPCLLGSRLTTPFLGVRSCSRPSHNLTPLCFLFRGTRGILRIWPSISIGKRNRKHAHKLEWLLLFCWRGRCRTLALGKRTLNSRKGQFWQCHLAHFLDGHNFSWWEKLLGE